MGIEAAVTAFFVSAGAGPAAAAFLGAAALYVTQVVAITALSLVLSKKQATGSQPLGARAISQRGSTLPQKIIYGTALVGGNVVYRNTHGPNNRQLWAVHELAGHQCHAILDVHLDDRVIENATINGGAAGGGAIASGDFGPQSGLNVVELWKHLGTSTQTVDTALQTAAGSGVWTNEHRLRGHAYGVSMFALFDRTEILWESGDPTDVKWLVQGKLIYDPRLDSTQIIDSSTSPVTMGSGAHRADDATTWAHFNGGDQIGANPALCAADMLRDTDFSPLAGGVASARIDWEAVASAADVCDVLVSIPTASTEKRYTCNGVVFGTATPKENMTAILSSMNGSVALVGEKYVINAGSYEAPIDALDEKDIIGPVGVKPSLTRRINTLKATYIDPDKFFQPTETAPIVIDAYKDTRDKGDELIDAIELPMTNSWYMAQRICQLSLQEANEEMTLTLQCNLRAARLVAGQRVNVTITERGWTPKIFKVIKWSMYDRGGNKTGVALELREDSAAAYADPLEGEYNTVDSTGTLTIANPTPIPSIDTIPNFGAGHYGGGAWNIIVTPNEDQSGSANDGEIRMQAGTFVPENDTPRVLSSNAQVNTPYEGAVGPPDGTAYVVWGATNPDTRFAAGNWGDSDAEAAGIFIALHDRFLGTWKAVDNDANEFSFTPLANDYIVARLIKTTATGGIDSLTTLIQYVEDPRATRGGSSDAIVQNPTFELGSIGWTPITGFVIDTTGPTHSGSYSARCTETGGVQRSLVNESFYPCQPGDRFAFGGYARTTSARVGGAVRWRINWYNSSFSYLSSVSGTDIDALAADTWHASFGTAVAPANAHFARLDCTVDSQTAGESLFDNGSMHASDNIDATGEPIPDENLLNSAQEWADLNNVELRSVVGENVNDWNIAFGSAPVPASAVVNFHVQIDRQNNKIVLTLHGVASANSATLEFELEIFGASFTSAALSPNTLEGAEVPVWQAGAIDFAAPGADNVWAPNGIYISSDDAAWVIVSGTLDDGAGFTVDSLDSATIFRLRIKTFNVTADRSMLTFGDTVILARSAEEATPIEMFFGARDSESYDALLLLNAGRIRNDQLVAATLSAINENPGFDIPRQNPLAALGPASWFGNESAAAIRYVDDDAHDETLIGSGSGLVISGAAFRPEVGSSYEIAVLAKKISGSARLQVTVSEYDTDLLATGKRAIAAAISGAGSDGSALLQTRTRETSLINPAPAFDTGNEWDLTTAYAIYCGTYSPTATARWASITLDSVNNSGSEVNFEWCVLRERATRNQIIVATDELGSPLSLPTGFGAPEVEVTIDAGDDIGDAEIVVTLEIDWRYTAADSDDSGLLEVSISHYNANTSPEVANSPASFAASFNIYGIPTSSAFTSFFAQQQTTMTRRFSPNAGLNHLYVNLRDRGAGGDAPLTASAALMTVTLYRR